MTALTILLLLHGNASIWIVSGCTCIHWIFSVAFRSRNSVQSRKAEDREDFRLLVFLSTKNGTVYRAQPERDIGKTHLHLCAQFSIHIPVTYYAHFFVLVFNQRNAYKIQLNWKCIRYQWTGSRSWVYGLCIVWDWVGGGNQFILWLLDIQRAVGNQQTIWKRHYIKDALNTWMHMDGW